MTTEKIHDFITNKDTEIVKDFAGSVTDSMRCSQEITRRLTLGRTAVEELGKMIKSTDVSLGTKLRPATPSCSQFLCTEVKAGQ